MGSYPVNPVLQGLTTAMSLADMLQRQRLADQEIALQRQRITDAEQIERNRSERENADLSMRLNAMGARQMTPSDELEMSSGMRVNFTPTERQVDAGDGLPQTSHGFAPSFAPSDLKTRLVKAGGQQWVLPSEEERAAIADRASERDTRRKVAETKATTQARIDTETAAKATILDKTGIPINDENAALLGLPKGTKILPEHLDDYTRSLVSARAAKLAEENDVRSAVPMYGEKESGVAVVLKNGTVKWNPIDIGGQRKTPESENSKRLSDKDALDKLVEQSASGYATKYETADEAIAAAKKDAETDPFVKRNYLTIAKKIRSAAPKPKGLNQMSAEELLGQLDAATTGDKATEGVRGQGLAGGSPKTAAPKAAGKGKADGAKVRAYATRYKISFAEAVAQAKKEGYDVSGLEAR